MQHFRSVHVDQTGCFGKGENLAGLAEGGVVASNDAVHMGIELYN